MWPSPPFLSSQIRLEWQGSSDGRKRVQRRGLPSLLPSPSQIWPKRGGRHRRRAEHKAVVARPSPDLAGVGRKVASEEEGAATRPSHPSLQDQVRVGRKRTEEVRSTPSSSSRFCGGGGGMALHREAVMVVVPTKRCYNDDPFIGMAL